MSKVASRLANSEHVAVSLDKNEDILSKTASDTIRALSYRVEELEKIAKITEAVVGLHSRGAIDESEIGEHVAALSENAGDVGYATKIAQQMAPMFSDAGSQAAKRMTIEEHIYSKIRR